MSNEANDIFRIDRLTLKNFRCFEERTFPFPGQFNVLIGDNQTGKTTVFDALRFALSTMLWASFRGHGVAEEEVPFGNRDTRLVTTRTDGLPLLEPKYPVEVRCDGVVAGSPAPWGRVVPETGREENPFLSEPFSARLLALQDQPFWPLIAAYGADRYSGEPTAKAGDPMANAPREYGYVGCLAARPNAAHFLRWMKRVQFVEDQEKRPMPAVDAAKRAVEQCVRNSKSLMYRALEDQLTVDLENGRTLPLDRLSDGVRSMVAMVGDMAWRCTHLNPDLGFEAVRETPGVVLIDEIDLHLHPSWQRRVVDDLKRAFPRVQFIATTHSPFIIQAAEAGEVIKLDDEDLKPDHEYADQPIEDIVEFVQGVEVPQRGQRSQDMVAVAEEYYTLLRQGEDADPAKKAELKARLDELAERYAGDEAYQALLKAEREAAGLGGDGS